MDQLQIYLEQYFFTQVKMASELGITDEKFDALLNAGVFAKPSYVIRDQILHSVVFGQFDSKGWADASYFHREMLPWMQRALAICEHTSIAETLSLLEQDFKQAFAQALQGLHLNEWSMPDAFTDDGMVIEVGLAKRCEANWRHYQAGIFGLCVASPVSAAAIAEKEVLQEKLSALSTVNIDVDDVEHDVERLLQLISRYEKISMPFTHLEYPRSSRFRLVEQLRHRLLTNTKAREDHTE